MTAQDDKWQPVHLDPCQDCGDIDITFGRFITVGELIEGLRKVPAKAQLGGLWASYFSEDEDQQDLPDDKHPDFVATIHL